MSQEIKFLSKKEREKKLPLDYSVQVNYGVLNCDNLKNLNISRIVLNLFLIYSLSLHLD
jgi:hypothetical protein